MAPRSGERGPSGSPESRRRASSTASSRASSAPAGEAGRGSPALDPVRHGELAELASRGDRPAQAALFLAELGLVEALARSHGGSVLPVEDLVQEGAAGLLTAIRELASGPADPAGFPALADRHVRLSIEAALEDESRALREKEEVVAAAQAYDRAEANLTRSLGRSPTTAEMAAKLEWPAARVEEVGDLVGNARDAHDEEILQYLDADALRTGTGEDEDGQDSGLG